MFGTGENDRNDSVKILDSGKYLDLDKNIYSVVSVLALVGLGAVGHDPGVGAEHGAAVVLLPPHAVDHVALRRRVLQTCRRCHCRLLLGSS